MNEYLTIKDEKILQKLKQSASLHGTSLEEEANNILTQGLLSNQFMSKEEAINYCKGLRKKYAHLQKTDSVDLIREDRER